jgi:hypothetical protein
MLTSSICSFGWCCVFSPSLQIYVLTTCLDLIHQHRVYTLLSHCKHSWDHCYCRGILLSWYCAAVMDFGDRIFLLSWCEAVMDVFVFWIRFTLVGGRVASQLSSSAVVFLLAWTIHSLALAMCFLVRARNDSLSGYAFVLTTISADVLLQYNVYNQCFTSEQVFSSPSDQLSLVDL